MNFGPEYTKIQTIFVVAGTSVCADHVGVVQDETLSAAIHRVGGGRDADRR